MATDKRKDDLSYNDIPDLNEDWGMDPRNGFQYSGESVQKFLKNKIQEAKETADEKIRAFHWEVSSLTMYGFTSEERKQLYLDTGDVGYTDASMPMEFTGTVRQLNVIDHNGGKNLYYTTTQDSAVLTVGFVSRQKSITDVEWDEVYEDFTVTVSVDKGSSGKWTIVENSKLVLSGDTFSIDVMKYLATGANRVKFTAVGSETGEIGTSTYTVTLTTMYLAASNFAWYRPFIEGTTYNLGGVNIGGNLQKVLKVLVTNSELGYEQLYEDNIGTSTYITNAYFFKGLEFPDTGTGTYHVEMWLDAEGLQSEHLEYNIMFISEADKFTATAVCINDTELVVNGSDSEMFSYAVYNKGAATASPTITVAKGDTMLIEETLSDVATSASQRYINTVEVDSEEPSFDIEATILFGESLFTDSISVDNSMSFPAVKGAEFYFNAATRNNNQPNREYIINEMNGASIKAKWTNFGFVDLMDGYTTDSNGRRCLVIPAGCLSEWLYQPLSTFDDGISIEFSYCIKNASNYSENAITVASNPTSDTFQGLRIRPKNICVHSRDLNSNDLAQSYNPKDDELVHCVLSITKNYKVNYGNLCKVFVNGVGKTSFSFTNTDSFNTAANILFGSLTADTYIYKVRVYKRGFGWQDAVQNFINCLPTQADKIAAWTKINSVLDDSYNINFDSVYGKYNTIEIEMLDDAVLPDVLHPAGGNCNLKINIVDLKANEMDDEIRQLLSGIIMYKQPIEGQGTTAMTYLRWNLRWKLLLILLRKRRITAKKNVASSMHSHKMGATRMFNDLFQKVVGPNEANARVSVFQYPAYAFLKTLREGTTDQYDRVFIGLYTVGPDKGDAHTFGYDDERFKNSLIHLEGTDHTPMAVGYDYPWDELSFDPSKEALGAVTATGDIAAAWEVGAAGQLDPSSSSDKAAVQAMLDSEFKPAYLVIYNNATSILGVSETLSELNVNPTAWRNKTTSSGKPYSELEFYTDGVYDLYYYNIAESIFKPTGINLLEQLGLTSSDVEGMDMASRCEYFKQKRRESFKANWENYWHKDDALFHDTFLELIGASDNFKKNNYPYKFPYISEGGKWRRRQDDLDSIFDVNNQGFAAKLYSVLLGDKTSTGSGSVFRGENSNFTILLEECCKEEKKRMIHRIFDAMVELSPYGQSKIERLVGYIRSCFWDYAQEYFTKSAYNADAEWTYEEAWPLWTKKIYKNDVDPLQQSLGDHYDAERDWVELRMVFMAAYYNWGPFSTDNGDDTSTGQISFRAAGGKTYTITPALDFNPTILIGQSDLATAGTRVKAGESVEVVVPDMGNNDTHVYIQGTDYLADLGDLSDLKVSADNPVLNVVSKRLRKLKVGDSQSGNVTSNVAQINMGECPSMEEVDARNLASLRGTVDLSMCPRLRKALFGGTSAANIIIQHGSKITELTLPGTLTTLSLVRLLNLTEANMSFDNLVNLAYLRLENNVKMDGFEMLKNAYLNSESLKNIRVVGFDYEGDSTDVDMIADFATAVDENGNRVYAGIDDEGAATTGLPVLDGKLKVNSPVYEDSLAVLKKYYPNLDVDAIAMYVRFADPEVQRIVAANWGDGTGITQEQIAEITDIIRVFQNNTLIETFDEFELFTKVTRTFTEAFTGCTNLRSISLPEGFTLLGANTFYNLKNLVKCKLPSTLKTINNNAFTGCTSLRDITLPPSITSIGQGAFTGGTQLGGDIYLPNLVSLGSYGIFNGSQIESISSLGKITTAGGPIAGDCTKLHTVVLPDTMVTLPASAFKNCTALVNLTLPKELTSFGTSAFEGCSALTRVNLPQSITTIGLDVFKYCTLLAEINLDKVNTILGRAFLGCSSLVDCGDLSSLQSIGDQGLHGAKLKGILSLPNLTSIGTEAFHSSSFTRIENLGSITSIALGNNNKRTLGTWDTIKSIVFPSTITSIGGGDWYAESEMEYMICHAETPPTVGDAAFLGNSNKCPIYVPDTSVTAYREASTWVDNADRIFPMEAYLYGIIKFADPAVEAICIANWDTNGSGYLNKEEAKAVTSLGTVFKDNTEITSFDELEQFTGITSISPSAFKGCTSLTTINLENVTKIGNDASWNTGSFDGCAALTKAIIPKVTELANCSFANCSSLTEVYVPNTTKIGSYAFYEAKIEGSHTFPHCTVIGGAAFHNSNIYQIIAPSVTTIEGQWTNGAFNGCALLTNVMLRDATALGERTFLNCTSLESFIFANPTPPTLGGSLFSGTNDTFKIYVPDLSVESYKNATNWSTFGDRIVPISQLATDNPTLYKEVEEYL